MFYLTMVAKYAAIRTFAPEDGTGGGALDAAAVAAAALAAQGVADAAAAADAAANSQPDAKPDLNAGGDADKSQQAKPDDDKVKLLREVMEKKEAARLLKDELKRFDGIDPTKYRDMIAKEQAAEQLAAEQKGDFDSVKKMMADAHAAEKKALEDRIVELTGTLNVKDGSINELTVGNSFGNSTFISEQMILSPAKTRALYGAHFEMEDGKPVGYDKPRGEQGRAKLVDASGEVMVFETALAKIVNADPDKKSILRSNVKPGAGSNTTPAKTNVTPQTDELYGRSRIMAGIKDA